MAMLLTNGARSRPCLHGHDRASEEPKGLISRACHGLLNPLWGNRGKQENCPIDIFSCFQHDGDMRVQVLYGNPKAVF